MAAQQQSAISGRTRARNRSTWAAVLALALFFTQSLAAAAQDASTVTVFSGPVPHFSALFVADAKGLFKKHGLNVTIRLFQSGAAAVEAFRAGRADYIAACDLPVINLLQTQDVILLAPVVRDTDGVVISARPGITRISDLKGKKVGVPLKTTSEYLVTRVLQESGLGIKDIELVNMGPADLLPALVRGDVDAAAWWQPFGWQSEEISGGTLKPLATSHRYYSLYCPISVTRKYGEANHKETIAFLKALIEAAQWLEKAPADEKARFVNDYLKGDLKTTSKLMTIQSYELYETAEYRNTMKEMATFMMKAGVIKKPIEWDKVLGTSYLREADPSLVR